MKLSTLMRQRPRGPRLRGIARVEAAWYSGLVLLLCTDLVLRNIDADLPLGFVLSGWVAAFLVPFVVLHAARRRR